MAWVKFHKAPKAVLRGASLESLTPKGKWLYQQSLARYKLTPDGIKMEEIGRSAIMSGEIGRVESFLFITA